MSWARTVVRLTAALAVAAAMMTTAPASVAAPNPPPTSTSIDEGAAPTGDSDGPGRTIRIDDLDAGHPRAARIGKWPGDTIRYWADLPASYRWSLDAAIAAWNDTGLDMRFVEAPRSKAKLTITIGNTGGGLGLATVGHQRNNWVRLVPGLVQPAFGESAAYARVVAARIIAHELGHNLGLNHTRGCQLMTAIVMLPDCRIMDADQPGFYACRIVDKSALDKAVDLYGGKRTPTAAACPADKLPPALTGVRFDGGFDEEEPVRLEWDPPPKAPAGSEVLGFMTKGDDCVFPVAQDFYKEASYDGSKMRIKRLDPKVGSWQPPADDIEEHCYGLQLVNRSGGGRPVTSRVLQSWVPEAPAPEVSVVRRHVGEWNAGSYRATVTWSSVGTDLLVLARPAGQCESIWPSGVPRADHRRNVDPGQPFDVHVFDATGEPVPDPCISFFVEGNGELRTSVADTWQVGTEPLPEPPTVDAVVRTGSYEYVPDVSYDDEVAQLAVVVRPRAQCVQQWPGGDPEDFVVDWYVETPGVLQPCLSFFTVNATGDVSTTAATWQVPPAPAPPTPTLTHWSFDQGMVEGRTDLDPDVYGLAAVEGPTGECPTDLPNGADPASYAADLWYDDTVGSTVFYTWTSGERPCVTFFAYNLDGVVGPGVRKQF